VWLLVSHYHSYNGCFTYLNPGCIPGSGGQRAKGTGNYGAKSMIDIWIRCDSSQIASWRELTGAFTRVGVTLVNVGSDLIQPPHTVCKVFPDMELFVGVKIDPIANLVRKQRELSKIQQQIASKQKDLDNPKFIERAPTHIVKKTRLKLAELEHQQSVLQDQIKECNNAR
jgi:valyl-tRNA synthetase